jgi:hypothetical protein
VKCLYLSGPNNFHRRVNKVVHERKCEVVGEGGCSQRSFAEKTGIFMALMALWDALHLLAGIWANMQAYMQMHISTAEGAPMDATGRTCRR